MIRLQVPKPMKQNIQHDTRELVSDYHIRVCLLDDQEQMIQKVSLVLSSHDATLLCSREVGEACRPVAQQRANARVYRTWLSLNRSRIVDMHCASTVSAVSQRLSRGSVLSCQTRALVETISFLFA